MATILEFKPVNMVVKSVNGEVKAAIIPLFPVRLEVKKAKPRSNTTASTAITSTTLDYKKKLIARVKIAQKQLGMEDATYRELLHNSFRVESCTKLNTKQLAQLLGQLIALGFKPSYKKPENKSFPQKLAKIEALLAEKGKAENRVIPWSYALAILHRQNNGCGDFTTASGQALDGVIAALVRDARRKNRYTEQWGQEIF